MIWLVFGWLLLSKKVGQPTSLENQVEKLVTSTLKAFAGISRLRNQLQYTKDKLAESVAKFKKTMDRVQRRIKSAPQIVRQSPKGTRTIMKK